jgi:hypothetical protein
MRFANDVAGGAFSNPSRRLITPGMVSLRKTTRTKTAEGSQLMSCSGEAGSGQMVLQHQVKQQLLTIVQ